MENKEFETIQEELKYKIITLEDEEEDSKIKKVIEDIVKEINEAFEKFKEWYEKNKDSEKAQEMKEKFLNEMNQFTNKAADVINDIKNNPELQEKFINGKDKVTEITKKIYTELETGVNTILENETIAKTIDTVSDKVVDVIQDEKVQNTIRKTKKGLLDIATSAYEGLKNLLGEKEEKVEVVEVEIEEE